MNLKKLFVNTGIILAGVSSLGLFSACDLFPQEQEEECLHEFVDYERIEPTCSQKGQEGGRYCSLCGFVMEYPHELETRGHAYDEVFGRDENEHWKACIYCGEGAINQEVHRFDMEWNCKTCGYHPETPVSKGLAFELSEDEQSYTLVGMGTCEDEYVIIPDMHEGLPVTKIGENLNRTLFRAQRVDVPDSVTTISAEAFYGCSNLQQVKLPNGLKRIEDGTFNTCSNLKTVVIPESVEYIGRSVFHWCYALTDIVIPSKVSYIGNATFERCYSLKTVEFLGTSLSELGNLSFDDCKVLESIRLPEGLKSIGESAFSGCELLSSVTLPDSLEEIGASAFSGCKSLNNVTFPDSLEEIGMSAFSGCEKIEELKLPKNLKIIESGTFSGCKSLKTVIFNEGLEEIRARNYGGSFEGCESLTELTFPKSLKIIEANAFRGCTGLKTVTFEDANGWVLDSGNFRELDMQTLISKLMGGAYFAKH